MITESVRAILRARGGRPAEIRRPGSHLWIHGLPLKMRFKVSKIYVSVIPIWTIGFLIGFIGADHGHRRRLHAGAGADLSDPRADRRGDRHLDGADAGHHGVCDHHPCGDQPSGRRAARADPDDRRRDRRAVRRAHRVRFSGEQLRLLLGVLVLAVGLRFAYDLVVQPTELYTMRTMETKP